MHQPDGSLLKCFASGDEYYVRLHDKNNYTIVQCPVDGYYYYAQSIKGKVSPSIYRADQSIPQKTYLKKNARISKDQYRKSRNVFWGDVVVRSTPTVGIINNINIFIRFSDEEEFTTPRSIMDEPFNKTDGPSMKHYFSEVSYSQLEVNTYHFPICDISTNLSYQDQYPRSYYQSYNAQTNPDGYTDSDGMNREHTLLKNAIEFILAEVPTELEVDGNNNGYVDNVTFLISGQPDGNGLLWPHSSSLYSYIVYINGSVVDNYNMILASDDYFTPSVLCHEFGHSLGAPDLYRYVNGSVENYGDPTPVFPVEDWDIMALACPTSRPIPQYMSAWIKYRYFHWIDCPIIEHTGEYELSPLSFPENNCFQIKSPFSGTQHFVVEYRKNEGIYDIDLPGNVDGMLIYRINLDINENGILDSLETYEEGELLAGWDVGGNVFGPPDEVYIYRTDGTHDENGQINRSIFSAETRRTEINDLTNPSSFLNEDEPGGLNISDIGNPGITIEFTCHVDCSLLTGDLNDDSSVDILDIMVIIGCIISNTNNCNSCLDLNDDDNVDILDIINLANMILDS